VRIVDKRIWADKSIWQVLGRALALGAGNAVLAGLIGLGLAALGLDPAIAAAAAVVFVLAPGAYNYLDRDLAGRAIVTLDPVEGNAPFIRFPSGKFIRPEDNGLNNADFVYMAGLLAPQYATLRSLVAELDRETWATLDPESDLADAVLDSLSALIDAVPDWTPDGQLPLFALFLTDLEGMMRDGLGLDFIHPEDVRRAPPPRSLN
jgi:hypothetical protein